MKSNGWIRLLIFLNIIGLSIAVFFLAIDGHLTGIPSKSDLKYQLPYNTDTYEHFYKDRAGEIKVSKDESDYEILMYDFAKVDSEKSYRTIRFERKDIDRFLSLPLQKDITFTINAKNLLRAKQSLANSYFNTAVNKFWNRTITFALWATGIPSIFTFFLYGIVWVFKGFRKAPK